MKESEFHSIQLINIVNCNIKEIGVLLDDELPHTGLKDLEQGLDRIWIETDGSLGVFAFLLDLVKNLWRKHHVILGKPDLVETQGVYDVHEIEEHGVLIEVILLVVGLVIRDVPLVDDTLLGILGWDVFRKFLVNAHKFHMLLQVVLGNTPHGLRIKFLMATNRELERHCYLSYFFY